MQMRDESGTIYDDTNCLQVSTRKSGNTRLCAFCLALVSVMQFAEHLSDRQEALAFRARIDWKDALSLPLDESGFHSSVLSEFRDRLVQGSLESKLLDTFLELWKPRGYLRTRGRQRTDSTHVLGAVKALNSLELVGETVRHALNVLATVVPEWLRTAGGSQHGLIAMDSGWKSIVSPIRQKRAYCPQYHHW